MRAGERRLVRETDAVTTLLINVQIEGDAILLEGGGELQAVLDGHGLVFRRVPDEARRRFFGDLKFVGEELDEFRRGIFAEQIVLRSLMRLVTKRDDGIAENPDVRPAAFLVDGVGGVGLARVEVGNQRRGGRC